VELTTVEKIRLLRQRFVHRTDTYAIQWLNRESNEWRFWRVTEGKCPNTPPCPRSECMHRKDVALTPKQMEEHVKGVKTLGVYQLGNDDTVKWLCLDVDINKDAKAVTEMSIDDLRQWVREHTRKLARVVQAHKLPFLVEFSGSKGYHIWLFFHEPVPAKEAMALGRFLNEQVEPPHFLHVEVFPKQAGQRSFGNLVKMPMGIHQKTGRECVFVGATFEPLADSWSALANAKTIDKAALAEFLDEHDVTIPESIRLTGAPTKARNGLPCLTKMLSEGVGEGRRDAAAFKLGCFFRNSGVPQEIAFAGMREWNAKNHPPVDEGTLALKVQSAYSDAYTHFPCQEQLLDAFCDPTCHFYAEKMRTRQKRRR
jgi:hypothetical protein